MGFRSLHVSSTRLPSSAPQASAWKRFRRSIRSLLSVSSSNPDAEHARTEPLRPAAAAGMTALPQFESKAPNPKRASYVPRHAASSFNSTTTPLATRDPERAKRASAMYASSTVGAEMGLSLEERRRRRVTMMV